MGKRLIRIFSKDILTREKELTATELNVVLKNKSTIHGTFVGIQGGIFTFNDMQLRKHKLNMEDIEEVIFDREAAY